MYFLSINFKKLDLAMTRQMRELQLRIDIVVVNENRLLGMQGNSEWKRGVKGSQSELCKVTLGRDCR